MLIIKEEKANHEVIFMKILESNGVFYGAGAQYPQPILYQVI